MKQILALMLGVAALLGGAVQTFGATGQPINKGSAQKYTLALIGDVPYGDKKVAAFPQFVDFLNADPKVDLVVHVGDIKNGSSLCSDEYFGFVRDQFNRIKDPVVFTPGDNDWTDCHRGNNGGYLPAERLLKLREVFYPVPGETLGGRHKRVLTQADDPAHADFVENVMWMEAQVLFMTINLPSSNDDNVTTNPWGAPWNTPEFKTLQAEEQATRDAANMAWLTKAFETAAANSASGVALIFQADMWDPTSILTQFPPIVNAIGQKALAFGKPVLMIVGDSHVFILDNPYSPASPLHSVHPGTPTVPNLTRVVLQGSTTAPDEFEYVRLTVDPRSRDVFSMERLRMAIP